MPTRSLAPALAFFVALTGACGSSNPDPRQPSLAQVQRSGLGAWAQVVTIYGAVIEGELISVEDEVVRVLPRGANTVVSLTRPEISSGKLFRYVAESSGFGGWGAIGTLSTLSHGVWLIFSAPIWLLWSGITTSSEANHVVLDFKPGGENWAQVAKWARFPQGMPRGFAQPPPGAAEPAPSGFR